MIILIAVLIEITFFGVMKYFTDLWFALILPFNLPHTREFELYYFKLKNVVLWFYTRTNSN